MSNYDNTNKGSLWVADAHSGTANIGGTEYFADLVPTNAKVATAPAATLYLRDKGKKTYIVAMFRPDRDAKYVLSGKHDDLRVRVFCFRGKSDNPKAPEFNLSFLDFDNQEPEKPQEEESQDNDTPF